MAKFKKHDIVTNGEFVGRIDYLCNNLECMGKPMYAVTWDDGMETLMCEGDIQYGTRCYDCAAPIRVGDCCVIDNKGFCWECCTNYVGDSNER